MEMMIDEAQACFDAGIYGAALLAALTIPDAAGFIEYPDLPNKKRYPKWFDTYVLDSSPGKLDGALAWALRNAIIHENAANWRPKGFEIDRVIIHVPPHPAVIHNCTIQFGDGEHVLVLNLAKTISAIINAARNWINNAKKDLYKCGKIENLLQIRPLGLRPFVIGIPVIA